jgi:SAM-dependent methyltransferase
MTDPDDPTEAFDSDEELPRGKRRSRHRLRVPHEVTPPVHEAAMSMHSASSQDGTSPSSPDPTERLEARADGGEPGSQPFILAPSSLPPASPEALSLVIPPVGALPVTAPPEDDSAARARPAPLAGDSVPSDLTAPVPASVATYSSPPEGAPSPGGTAMRVVRRRIHKIGGGDESLRSPSPVAPRPVFEEPPGEGPVTSSVPPPPTDPAPPPSSSIPAPARLSSAPPANALDTSPTSPSIPVVEGSLEPPPIESVPPLVSPETLATTTIPDLTEPRAPSLPPAVQTAPLAPLPEAPTEPTLAQPPVAEPPTAPETAPVEARAPSQPPTAELRPLDAVTPRRSSKPPPPPPSATRASNPPPATAPQSTSSPAPAAQAQAPAATPSTQAQAAPDAAPTAVVVPAAPAVPAVAAELAATTAAAADSDDESVEISLDDAPEPEAPRKPVDPSLAMLDELAEAGGDSPSVSIDADAEAQRARGQSRATSMPPPPPPDAARGKGAGPAIKLSGMPTIPEQRRRRRFWWEELFNDDFLRTMEKLTPDQTRAEADAIEQALGVESGASILDVACGIGRQAIELARRKYDVVGLDLSLPMLSRASETAQDQNVKLTFAHADMAVMEYTEVFDAAYCVGSSFGFFDDARNVEVTRRIHKSLKPHGTFLLGVLNRDHTIQHQPGMAWFEGDGCVCMEETAFNFITSRLSVKRTMIFDDGRQREIEYSVRLYSLHELGQILHEAGFRILEVSGNVRTPGAFFGPASRELVILAQKRGTETVELTSNNPSADTTAEMPRSNGSSNGSN